MIKSHYTLLHFTKAKSCVKIGGFIHYPGEYVISSTKETVADIIKSGAVYILMHTPSL